MAPPDGRRSNFSVPILVNGTREKREQDLQLQNFDTDQNLNCSMLVSDVSIRSFLLQREREREREKASERLKAIKRNSIRHFSEGAADTFKTYAETRQQIRRSRQGLRLVIQTDEFLNNPGGTLIAFVFVCRREVTATLFENVNHVDQSLSVNNARCSSRYPPGGSYSK